MLPLEGVRVLDLSQQWAMPLAGAYLADQGAEVVKVEPPGDDAARSIFIDIPIRGEGRSWLAANRNKRGIVVDIRKPEGQKIVYKLVRRADVLMLNFRPTVGKRLGFDYETIRRLNPRLIYVHLTAYGSKGRLADKRGYDRLVQALSGIYGKQHLPDGTPIACSVMVADQTTPILLVYGIVLALLMREKTGRGRKVESLLLNGTMAIQALELVAGEGEAKERERASAGHFLNHAMDVPYRCSDGQYLIILVLSDKEFADLCRAADVEHLARDSKFLGYTKRAEQTEELYQIFEGIFSTRPRDEWIEILMAHDVPCMPILRPFEILDHSQTIENEMVTDTTHPIAGRTRMVGTPFKLSDCDRIEMKPAPLLGEHTEEVLLELKYPKSKIKELEMKKVIACRRI